MSKSKKEEARFRRVLESAKEAFSLPAAKLPLETKFVRKII